VRSGQIKSGQFRSGLDKSDPVRSYQVEVMLGWLMSMSGQGQVSSAPEKFGSGKNKVSSGDVKSCHIV